MQISVYRDYVDSNALHLWRVANYYAKHIIIPAAWSHLIGVCFSCILVSVSSSLFLLIPYLYSGKPLNFKQNPIHSYPPRILNAHYNLCLIYHMSATKVCETLHPLPG